ncbi:DUF1641 domain-containing protein [Haloarculaceae archaeon H-GB2-1]|nr:DUF1641 domain-containing protein [Haloarculaceae archaeon H-GB1-1]MEA5389027.1 DUF1641 domain-containing protein [Haloarculaceae archaeon H-GB11]MEA5407088.1 DUF1641 domain-containing protein [Haloarculaceae archaeon H-GB2-1]
MSEQEQSTAEQPEGDAGTDVSAGSGLESLVAENPEEVARFLERLGLVNDLLDTAELATSAMDDRMVQELTGTATNLGAAADGMATEDLAKLGESTGENAAELADAIEGMAKLQRSGTLDDLLALGDAVALGTAAMDDEMVMKLTATGSKLGELADTAADDDVARSLEAMLEALGEASDEEPTAVGAFGLLGAMRDPEVKQGMGFLVAVARALGRKRRR